MVEIIDAQGFKKLMKTMAKLERKYELVGKRCPVKAARLMKSFLSKGRKLDKTYVRRVV